MAVLAQELMRNPYGVREDLARLNLIAFAKHMYPAYRAARHHWRIAEALQAVERGEIRYLAIMMPPRHGKSQLASECFPPWYLGRNPNRRIIACSYGDDLALTFSRHARNMMLDDLWPFPEVMPARESRSVKEWDLEDHRGGYWAAGVGAGVTGRGANILLIDDAVKDKEAADSEVMREKTWDWYQSTAYTRLNPEGGAVILIGTRWHEDDLIGRALNDGDYWHVLRFPAEAEEGDQLGREPGEWLWPEQFSAERYQEIRARVGTRNWNTLYQQRPAPAEGGTFKRHWWRFWHYPGQPLPAVPVSMPDGSLHMAPCLPLPPFWDEQLQSWDMAFKDNEDSDFVCGQIWAAWRADRYLLDQTLARLDFPATLASFRDLTDRWPRARRKLVEDKANGPAVIATLRNEIAGIVAVNPEGGKEARANAVTPEVESGNVYLPHPRLAPWVDAYIEELASFPAGKHDDQVDATSQALLRMAYGKGSVTTTTSYVDDPEDERDPRGW